ncbi:MAG: porin [Phaeovulum sp.]|uniref:porin n=1 Tax=Phaeovulum sp. TaxID=2934796 RepID=UPI00272EF7A8|nr:porin [Phaeovulum sp.]MDP2063927.1 porin [Phaeovulum sp.]
MKKLLIATTALVLVAGAATAEVKMTGDARFGLSYNSANAVNDFTAEYRVRAKFNMSGKTDGGLGFGASFILTGSSNTTTSDATGSSMVWVSGSWGQVSVGEGVDTGSDSVGLGIADVGYKGIGVDDLAEGLYAESAANINYTGTFGAVTVGVSYNLPVAGGTAADQDWSIGVGYKGDGFKVALGYDSAEFGTNTLTIGGGVTMGAISANVIYSMPDAGADAYGVDFGYKLNSATALTVAYATDGTDTAFGVGVAYTMGGGAKLVAGIGEVAGDTKAEVGMTFSF